MKREEVKDLYLPSGNEVALHGTYHISLTTVDDGVALNDVMGDRASLELLLDTIVTGYAYPCGRYDDRTADLLRLCGVSYARTIDSTERFDIPKDWLKFHPTCSHSNPRLMELAKEFVEYKADPKSSYLTKAPKLFCVWGHSYSFDDYDNWHIIEEFAEYVGNREDIWYATNMEIYRYIKAYDSLVFGINRNCVYNPSAIDVYINYFDKEYVVPAGKTIPIECTGK